MKTRMLIPLFCVFFLLGCSLNNDHERKTGLMNPEQTNLVTDNILSVEEAKECVIRDIIESGYALPEGEVLQEHPYLSNVNWGPVIFVENIGTEGRHKYYYVFYGQMPDGAVAVHEAVDAQTGEVFRGGMISYSSTEKVFVLSPEEARAYAVSRLGISKDTPIKAVFYRDWSTMNYDETFCWKYQLVLPDASPLRIKDMVVDALYVDPYVVGLHAIPTSNNVINRYFTTRIYTLQEHSRLVLSLHASTNHVEVSGKQFVSVE